MKRQKTHPTLDHDEPPVSFWWRQDWLLGFLLVAVTFLAYQPVWHAGFIWDDDTFLTDNPVIKSADGLYRMWFTAATPDYFPVTSSTLWLEWSMWGNNPMGYHLVNILLHSFSAALLWRVLQRLKIPGAFLAAAIFALHPVNVESVAWITERKNTLAMFFYAGTLLCWLKFEDSGRGRWYGLALAGFALALLSKTAVAPLPLVLLGIIWWRRGRLEKKDVRRVAPFIMVAAAMCLVTVWFQYHKAIGSDVIRTDGFWSRLAGAGWAVWFYLYKAALPLNLAFVYPRWKINPGNGLTHIPLVLLAAALVLCWRKSKTLFFGLAYFVVMLLPILGFLNIYFMRYSLVADHWEYFAIIGPIALAAAIIRRPVAGAALLLALGVLTWKQCGMYANEKTLWQTTLRLNPNAGIAYNNLGYDLLYKEGQAEEAIAYFKKALEIDPNNEEACNNLGNGLLQEGRMDEAVIQYQNALQIKPLYAEPHYNLGNIFLQKGQIDAAIAQYQKTLEIKPGYAEAHNNFGNCLMQQGKVDEAIIQYQTALQISPRFAEAHYNLANVFRQKGRVGEAILHYQNTLQIEPNNPKVQNSLAWLLATNPDASLRNGGKAVELARQANELAGGRNPIVLRTLAAAYAEVGQFGEARLSAQKAIALVQAAGREDMAKDLNSDLKRYETGLPLRQ